MADASTFRLIDYSEGEYQNMFDNLRVGYGHWGIQAARDIEDKPRIEGIDESCINCRLCVDLCPGDAITHEKQEVRGVNKWVVDTEACAPYFASYHACGICLQVCPWNARGFEGKFKKTFIQTIKGLDRTKWREELQAGFQEPWDYVERPKEFHEGWRMQVKGKGAASKTFQGKPV